MCVIYVPSNSCIYFKDYYLNTLPLLIINIHKKCVVTEAKCSTKSRSTDSK